MHKPYEEILNQKCDFRVKYRFYTKEEGGRTTMPFQGIRFDFWYPYEGHNLNSVYMIWPEFEDESGNLILEKEKRVNNVGTARMWIIANQMRAYHQDKIIIGTKGFILEGRPIAECEVIEIIDLHKNPTEPKNTI